MDPSEPSVLLSGLALALALGAAVAGLRARGAGGGAGLAVVLAACALASLAGAALILSASLADARAAAGARDGSTSRLLSRVDGARIALDVRLDEVTEGIRDELHSRDRHRTALDERVAGLASDLHALQVANTELRRMLVDVTGSSGLLITREGRFRPGTAGSTFEPCGWGESWEVTFSPGADARARLVELLDGRTDAPVAFTGVLSTPGAYGEGGVNRHLFLVIDGEAAERADCG